MADITLEVTFLPKGRNVRPGPIVGRSLGCEAVIDGSLYGVRFELEPGRTIELGSTVVLEGTFDEPESALAKLAVGKTIRLWERGAMADAKVLKIHRPG